MSEPIPESIPTSADPRTRRPLKKSRPNPSSSSNPLADDISHLFSDPTRQITLPDPSSSKPNSAPAPPEIVTNVQGSSAGAGSGEFHVYKASRRREYERIRKMDEEVEKEKADDEWEAKKREREEEDERKRLRNKEKRERSKKRGKGGSGGKGGRAMGGGDRNGGGKNGVGVKHPGEIGDQGNGKVENGNGADATEDTAATGEEVGVVIHDDD